jgi:hypothetical protein
MRQRERRVEQQPGVATDEEVAGVGQEVGAELERAEDPAERRRGPISGDWVAAWGLGMRSSCHLMPAAHFQVADGLPMSAIEGVTAPAAAAPETRRGRRARRAAPRDHQGRQRDERHVRFVVDGGNDRGSTSGRVEAFQRGAHVAPSGRRAAPVGRREREVQAVTEARQSTSVRSQKT